jgi:large subunit ribosomal protein L29
MDVAELRKKTDAELRKELMDSLREQFNLRMQKGVGQGLRPSEFGRVRKQIARIKTVLNERARAGETS